MATTFDTRPSLGPTLDAARAIESLANSNVTEDKFFQQFVETLADALSAEAGAVWLLGQTGLLALMSETRLDAVGLTRNPASHPGHLELMLASLKTGQAAIHAPGQSRKLPSRHVLLQAPVRYKDRPIGVVELFLPEDAPADGRLDQLQFLEEMCVCAGRYLAWRAEAGSPSNHLEFWSRFERLIARLHASLDAREVAATAANDGRLLLSCDRVSVAVRRGPRTVILAISGQDTVNRRSNLVRLMSSLAAAAIRAGQPIACTGRTDEVPPPLLPLVTEYVHESGSRMVKVIPLHEPSPDADESAPEAPRRTRRPAFGAIVVEQVAESWLTPLIAERTDLLAQHVAGALHNARRHERIFLLPLWRGLGRLAALLHGRTLVKTLLAAAVAAGAGASLALVPAEYRVEAAGTLMPAVQRDVFAPWDGDVVELFVTSGQQVEANQPLLRLRNDELNTEVLTARSRLDEKRQQLDALRVEIDEAARTSQREEGIRLRGKHAQTQVEADGLEKRIKALEEQQATLTVRAPIAGTVATFQLEQRLLHRPATRGEVLLELMDESGPWRLEVEVPEHRMGHVLAAQQAAAAQLPVEFVLATHPDHAFRGTLDQTATRAGASPEHGTTVAAHVTLDPAALPARRIGAEVQAKIHCGERSLFYVLFGDVVEFARKQWW